MNEKGSILIQVLIGLFLLGLIASSALPILNTARYNFMLVEIQTEMTFIAESIIEEIKSFDYYTTEESELIFDLKLEELMEMLKSQEEVDIYLPLDNKELEYKYKCHIHKIERNNLWEIKVDVFLKDEVKEKSNVEIMAFLPIPK
jgi:hypothetical protein